MGDRENNWLKTLIDRAQKFWPISLVLMALTLLSQVETLQTWSDGLAFVVDQWRYLIQIFWELLINFIRALMQLPRLKIDTPTPEILTFISLFFTSIRAKTSIDHHLTNLSDRTIEGTRYEPYIFGVIVFLFIALSVIALGVLFSSYRISLLILFVMFWCALTVEYIFKRSGYKHEDIPGQFAASFWFVTGAAVILAGLIFAAAVFLELVVEYFLALLDQFESYQREKI